MLKYVYDWGYDMKNILEFLGIKKKKTSSVSVQEDINQEVPVQESEEERIRRQLMEKEYHYDYIFSGMCRKTIEIDGKTITYDHREDFLTNSRHTDEITKVIRLTGDNLTGKPIIITYREFNSTTGRYWNYFYDEGYEYFLSSTCLSGSGSITGYELDKRERDTNKFYIDFELEKLAKHDDVDEMFKD